MNRLEQLIDNPPGGSHEHMTYLLLGLSRCLGNKEERSIGIALTTEGLLCRFMQGAVTTRFDVATKVTECSLFMHHGTPAPRSRYLRVNVRSAHPERDCRATPHHSFGESAHSWGSVRSGADEIVVTASHHPPVQRGNISHRDAARG